MLRRLSVDALAQRAEAPRDPVDEIAALLRLELDALRVFVNLKLPPVFFFWYLLIQRGSMEADIHPLHIPDFLCNCVIVGLLGSVKHGKTHFMPGSGCFR